MHFLKGLCLDPYAVSYWDSGANGSMVCSTREELGKFQFAAPGQPFSDHLDSVEIASNTDRLIDTLQKASP
jgi:hypothetical protein